MKRDAVNYDVVIAGAGPAGIATAIALLRADAQLRSRILVVDRARFPRAKPCGGGLTGRVDEAFVELGLTLDVPWSAAPSAVVRYGSFVRTVELPRPVRVVRREEFDASLVHQATALGIEIRQGDPVLGFRTDSAGVQIDLRSGPLRSKIIVGGDGAGSLVRSYLHRNLRSRIPLRLFRAELLEPPRHVPQMVYDFTPMVDGLRGYMWLFPVPDGRVNVGLMHEGAFTSSLSGRSLVALLRRRLATDHKLDLGRAPVRGWPAWGYDPAAPVASERVVTVGDAAGIDGLTGEGIAVALEQGIIAGRAIADGLACNDFRFATYERLLRSSAAGRDVAFDRHLARLLYTANYSRWLPLILYDQTMIDLYAARVSGIATLSDEKSALIAILLRHGLHWSTRRQRFKSITISPSAPLPGWSTGAGQAASPIARQPPHHPL